MINELLLTTKVTGLGDKLLSLIGFIIFTKYTNKRAIIILNDYVYRADWGENIYDLSLFNFELINNMCEIYNRFIDFNKNISYIENASSITLSPLKIYNLINSKYDISYRDFSNEYNDIAQKIRPSSIIEQYIPSNIHNCYGVHLRKTDKVKINPEHEHENTIDEFQQITNYLLLDLKYIIESSDTPVSFLFVSEDVIWKHEFITLLKLKTDKPFDIVSININSQHNSIRGFNSVLDMFCLSRCKIIFQGVKWTTFSTISSLIGNVPIKNYYKILVNHSTNYIYSWKSTLLLKDDNNEIEITNNASELGNIKIIHKSDHLSF